MSVAAPRAVRLSMWLRTGSCSCLLWVVACQPPAAPATQPSPLAPARFDWSQPAALGPDWAEPDGPRATEIRAHVDRWVDRFDDGDDRLAQHALRKLLGVGAEWLGAWYPRLHRDHGEQLKTQLERFVTAPVVLEFDHPALAVAWIALWRQLRHPQAMDQLVTRLTDEDSGCAPVYRDCRRIGFPAAHLPWVAAGLVEIGDRRAVGPLVARLSKASSVEHLLAPWPRGYERPRTAADQRRLQGQLMQALRSLTGESFGTPEAWLRWWEKQPDAL